MSPREDPWWASAAAADGLEDVDPVEAFRAARRPSEPLDGGGADGAGADGAGARGTGQADPPASPPSDGHRPELCGICPLCTLARSLEQTRPELLEHLTEAARHLAAAARALVEQPPTPPPDDRHTGSSGGGHRAGGDGLERIHLDDDRDTTPPPPAPASGRTDEAGDTP